MNRYRSLTIRPNIPGRTSENFHGQMVQSFSSVENDNCSLGIFQWLPGLDHKYRSKQNTDKSASWLSIFQNSRDLAQTTTAAKTSQNKGLNESASHGSARVINLCTFLSQPMQNKQVHHGGIININAFFTNLAAASICRQISRKVLKCFFYRMRVAVILAWDVQLAVIVAKRTSSAE